MRVVVIPIKEFYDYSIVRHNMNDLKFYFKAYSIDDFLETTLQKKNLRDMQLYTESVFETFRNNLKDN